MTFQEGERSQVMTFQVGEHVQVMPNSRWDGETGYYGTVIAMHVTSSGRFMFIVRPHDNPSVSRMVSLHSLRGVTTQENE
jgi:hypothetical protein